jgi:hypothetical protein
MPLAGAALNLPYATEVTLVRGKKNQNSRRKAQLTIAHREPMTGIIKKFLTPQEVADVRKGMIVLTKYLSLYAPAC